MVQLIIGRVIARHDINSSLLKLTEAAPWLPLYGGAVSRRLTEGGLGRASAVETPPHPPQCAHWGTCPYPLCPFGTTSLPLLAFGHFPLTGGIGPLTRGVGPLWGEGSWAVQIGRDSFFCGTFGYIYWELWQSAPVGRRAAQCAAPTAKTWQARAARREAAPYKRGGGGKSPPYVGAIH